MYAGKPEWNRNLEAARLAILAWRLHFRSATLFYTHRHMQDIHNPCELLFGWTPDIVVQFLGPSPRVKWESGENPELPRSGKQVRTPIDTEQHTRLGSLASRVEPVSPKTCPGNIR